MKKCLKFIILIIIIIFIIVLFYISNMHSPKNISSLINPNNEIPNNIYIKKEVLDNRINSSYIEEMYKKENIVYYHYYKDDMAEHEEILWNFDEEQKISINHATKTITIQQSSETELDTPIAEELLGFKEFLQTTEDKYKYYGIESIDNRECIKFSLTDTDDDINYYYIDLTNHSLYKSDFGKIYKTGFISLYTSTYIYSYDTVTDENILKFDINNYPDYKYTQN